MPDFREQREKLASLEQLHYQVHCPVSVVDDELVDANDVFVLQLGDVLELGLHVEQHFVVSRLNHFDGEQLVSVDFAALLDQSDRPLAQHLQLLEPVAEPLNAHFDASVAQDFHLVVLGQEEEDVSLRRNSGAREVC